MRSYLSPDPYGEEMRIVYFGWDEFAVPTLMNSDHEVLGVITTSSGGTSNGAPLANPVEVQAGKFAVPVYNFGATDASNILKEIQNLKAELGIVVSFGEECPGSLSRAFPVGCIEIHPSLLPKYRGPDPIRWAINNKERKTGVTVFRVTD